MGPRTGSTIGRPPYLVRLTEAFLYLQPWGGQGPWYLIPRSAISGAAVQGRSVALHLAGHRDIEFRTYTGAPLDELLESRLSAVDAAHELATKPAGQRTTSGPIRSAVRRAQLALTALCIVVAVTLATDKKWPVVSGVVVART